MDRGQTQRSLLDHSNERQLDRIAVKIEAAAAGSLTGKTVAVWGLTFKAGTNDLRSSPSLAVIERLEQRGAKVVAYDPAAAGVVPGIAVTADPYSACRSADVLVVLTEWPEFVDLDFRKVRELLARPSIVDTRNLLPQDTMLAHGFHYERVGRPRL